VSCRIVFSSHTRWRAAAIGTHCDQLGDDKTGQDSAKKQKEGWAIPLDGFLTWQPGFRGSGQRRSRAVFLRYAKAAGLAPSGIHTYLAHCYFRSLEEELTSWDGF
jgi:hypothetical protein